MNPSQPPQLVYHASHTQGLTRLTPQVSTHGQAWLYATDDPAMSAIFLTRTDDFVCASGLFDGLPCIVERFAGAFNHAYAGIKGSIYVLPGDTFVAGQTDWEGEWISSEAVIPQGEIDIVDAKAHLLGLAADGRLSITYYPERLHGIPDDDEDLVQKAVAWKDLEKIERYHPHLLSRVRAALQG